MTTSEKIEHLKKFQNEKEFREFLIDFLKKSGFKDVMHTHRYGAPEQGKDIIGRYHHAIEGDDWYAFVVKKGRIGGGTNEIETIKNQIKQSFEYPYVGVDGVELKINKVKVVTNENFTGGGQSQISSSPELKIYNNFNFWWNETLIPLIDNNYPEFWLPGNAFSKEFSKSFVNKLQQEIEIRELSIRKIDDKKIQKLLEIFVEPKLTTSVIHEDKRTKEKSVKRKSVNLSTFNNITENILLQGEQGSGKTKVLNTIACNLSHPEIISKAKKIPIKLKAPSLRDLKFNIAEGVRNEIAMHAEQFYDDSVLDDYKVILFIDDLDLLNPSEKDDLISNVKDYCLEQQTNFVITYRKSEYEDDAGLKTINLHNFDVKQVESFVLKFFEGTERGARFIQILKESDILAKLPTTPLTVTLLSLLYDENNFEIPATLSDIYTDFTSVLLGKLEIRNKNELLIYNIKTRLFSSLALKMLDARKFEISYKDYKLFINEFLSDRGYEAQNDDEVNLIISRSGLLYKDDMDNVGFKQQAFIEFFASLEIYHHKRDTHYPKLVKLFNDVNWQNTAIFYAGHSKELEGMIDDVIMESPNNDIKDWFVNTGGMGYLSQALYQTKPSERKKLVLKSLENLRLISEEIKKETGNKDSMFKDMSLPLISVLVTYWFRENFKSITLTKTLEVTFDEIFSLESNYVNNFNLLIIATTLLNPYIGKEERFEKLIDREEFIKHPVLPLVADLIMDLDSIEVKNISADKKEKIVKTISKKREYIKAVLKEPAYRFNDSFALMEKNKG